MKKLLKENRHLFPKRVAIIYSEVKREYFPTQALFLTEKGAYQDVQVIARYLRKLNLKVKLYPGNSKLPNYLKRDQPEMAFNLVDSIKGSESLACAIPGVLEILEIPYTGAGILGMSLDSNKFVIKKLLQENGVPVPNYQLFNTPIDPLDPTLRFPLISKLNDIHGAVEINQDAVSENEKHLRDRIRFLIQTYKQPILVEEFIVGREITAILFEGINKKVYLAEKVFKNKNKFLLATFADQWLKKDWDSFSYQKYEDPLLVEYVRKAFDITKMDDYGKFDIRMDSSGRYFFIDSNTNPAFGPEESDCTMAYILDLYGINFTKILRRLILNTLGDWLGKEKPFPLKMSRQ